MQSNARWLAALGLLACGVGAAAPVAGQAGPYENVISANPFGILLEFFNAEYERAVTESSTWGIGGSYGEREDEDDLGVTTESTWFNGDVFWRFYPSGDHFEGWNFGVKAGLTHQETDLESGTNFGIGFDANRSWLLGTNDNFYVGIGFGLKRLFGDIPEDGIEVVPTLRIVNVGFAF
jgi:hypothetical protein